MKALALFVIVQLANGELRTVHSYPAITNREPCHVIAREMTHGGVANDYMRAGAKRVLFVCAPPSRPIVIAR